MRSPTEDIDLCGQAGVWDGDRDPLLNAVVLLCMHAKRRHRPVVNVHNLANALEKGDGGAVQLYYDRLAEEVRKTLSKYPDIVRTLETMAAMSDEELEQIDRVMQE